MADAKGRTASLWTQAWRSRMRALGFPRVAIDVDPATGNYGWYLDLDAFMEGAEACMRGDHTMHEQMVMSRADWMKAMEAFMDVDSLRPDYVKPAAALLELTSGFTTMDELRDRLDGQHPNHHSG